MPLSRTETSELLASAGHAPKGTCNIILAGFVSWICELHLKILDWREQHTSGSTLPKTEVVYQQRTNRVTIYIQGLGLGMYRGLSWACPQKHLQSTNSIRKHQRHLTGAKSLAAYKLNEAAPKTVDRRRKHLRNSMRKHQRLLTGAKST